MESEEDIVSIVYLRDRDAGLLANQRKGKWETDGSSQKEQSNSKSEKKNEDPWDKYRVSSGGSKIPRDILEVPRNTGDGWEVYFQK